MGCAAKRSPQPPSALVTAQLARIALPIVRFQPDTDLKAPTSGKGAGAAQGAGRGALAGAKPGLAIAGVATECVAKGREVGLLLCGPFLALGLGVAAAGSTIGGLRGAVKGAVAAEPAAKIDQAKTDLHTALAGTDVQLLFRDRVLRLAHDHSRLAFIALDDPAPTAADHRVDYRPAFGNGIDTILEVSLRNIRLSNVTGGVNPPVELRVEARARLIRTQDGVELYAETLHRSRGAATFTEWAADDAKLFREELDRASSSLAEEIVRLVFADTPPWRHVPAISGGT